jgi:putative serine protease PepD
MARIRRTLIGSTTAALAGGLVVSLIGWAAFAAGLVAGSGSGGGRGTVASSGPVAASASAPGPSTVAAIYRRDGRGVVHVEARRGTAAGSRVATGSGFVIDRAGHVITNAHVIDGAGMVEVRLGPNAPPVRARVLGRDRSTDVALLEVNRRRSAFTRCPSATRAR